MGKKTFITTPLYYVNAKPHIGHAYTNILCDTFARYYRLIGQDVFFLTGTDEHGTKIQKAALDKGEEPKAYVDAMLPHFKELWSTLNISYDYFIRTVDENHKKVVRNILVDLEKKGDIYKSSYRGWYCLPCESFWTKLQLVEGKCPDCHRDVEEIEEENYFFKLSKYQDWLIQYIQDHPDFVYPEIRKNEILGFLKQPLEDLCITRPKSRLSWGIDYPGSSEHVVYVWFDALINYVSAPCYTLDEKKFKSLWPAQFHLVGKDILRQHAIYWPIMLKAMGLVMPERIIAHGWWKLGGTKVSKSRGNAVNPIEIVHKYGVDALRYFLLNEVTLGLDGSYSEDLLCERYTSDLANDLGNLVHRVTSMIGRYFEGKMPEVGADLEKDPLIQNTYALWEKVEGAMNHYDLRKALGEIWTVMTEANQFAEQRKPWALAKDPSKREELTETLGVLAEIVVHFGILLLAFLPETAKKILERFGVQHSQELHSKESYAKRLIATGTRIEKGDPLFPRLEEEPV